MRAAVSAFSNLPLVIEPADLAARLDAPELILVDLTSAARYAEGHLPGARFVDPKQTQLGQPPAPGLLPDIAQLQRLFGAVGHRHRSEERRVGKECVSTGRTRWERYPY